MGVVDPLHIAVTGANGFLGREICAQAEARGHRVTRVVRSSSAAEAIVEDLSSAGAARRLAPRLEGVDAIIHAASEMSSDWELHQRSSLPAAKAACDLAEAIGAHLVHISSIAIYDYQSVQAGETISESTQIETKPQLRDGYVRAKLAQEELIAHRCPAASVLRIGALFGPGRLLNGHLGIGLGPVLLRLSSNGQIPLAHVALAAQLAVKAAEHRPAGAVNIVDNDLPDRVRFINALSATGWPKLVLPLPWALFGAIGRVLGAWSGRPGLLRRPVLHARMKPVAFDNSLMNTTFDVPETSGFETLMKKAARDG